MGQEHPLTGDNALGELRSLAKNIQSSLRKTTVEKIKVGDWLTQARQLLTSDNEFGDWCKENFPGLNRHTRQNYMNLAKVFGGELFNTTDLLSDTALYLLARPGTPKSIQDFFIQQAHDGKKIKVIDIKNAKVMYSEVEDRDKDLFNALQSQGFSKFDTRILDSQRGGSQAERIRAAQNGSCVLAYPFDEELISWATENNCLLNAPNENIDQGNEKPFYNFWLYRNNNPSERMVFDNFWRHTRSPKSALAAYELAINSAESELRKYAVNLKGYVLHAGKVDAHWHGPVIAKLVNDGDNRIDVIAEQNVPAFWMSDAFDISAFSIEELAERLRFNLASRGDKEEIRRFIGVLKAMNLAAPSLKAYLY